MPNDIAVIPGDGIGTEVVDRSWPVAEAAADAAGVSIETADYGWGSERYLAEGAMMPEDGLDRLRDHDAIFLGAVGHPEVPDYVTLGGLRLEITKGFKQHVCERPTHLFEGVTSPLREYAGGEIDFVVYRQNTEGEYADIGGREYGGFDNEVAVQSALFTREGTETIVRAAFEAAADRDGELTNVTKSNAQAHGMVFWDDIVDEVGAEYPGVSVERLLVDAASMDLVRRPEEFDVLVASNLFGDILTDLGAGISGSLGLAPSSNVDPTREHPSMFEPVHGSAFDIAGEGIANPIGAVRSWALLFEHLGEASAASKLRDAVADQLADPDAPRTPDIGGTSGTGAVTADLRERIE
jgi:tartrate dehydrogenase/decarboxylase/D-malate dehydrogenase